MVGSVVILAASSGKNYALANKFCDTFTDKGVNSKVVDLTQLYWPVYTPEMEKDSTAVPDTSGLSDLISDATKGRLNINTVVEVSTGCINTCLPFCFSKKNKKTNK